MTRLQIIGSWLLLVGVTAMVLSLTLHQSDINQPLTSIPSESAHPEQIAK